jgi:hypothetical protein
MAFKRLTSYIFIFNVLMVSLLFFSSQFVMFILNGTIVQDVGFYIDYGFPLSNGMPIPTVHAPLLNYPLFVFIFTIVGNVIFILHRKRENRRTHIDESKVGR